VSSIEYDGNLGGLAGADAKCQALADAQSLGGQWIAWLSAGSTNAKDRLTSGGPFILLDGTLVANNLADLTDGALAHAINVPEALPLSGGSLVWTGTRQDGTSAAGLATGGYYDCIGWSTNAPPAPGSGCGSPIWNGDLCPLGEFGVLDQFASADDWTEKAGSACFSTAHLYCFEQH
jgi:hypothetical protein